MLLYWIDLILIVRLRRVRTSGDQVQNPRLLVYRFSPKIDFIQPCRVTAVYRKFLNPISPKLKMAICAFFSKKNYSIFIILCIKLSMWFIYFTFLRKITKLYFFRQNLLKIRISVGNPFEAYWKHVHNSIKNIWNKIFGPSTNDC